MDFLSKVYLNSEKVRFPTFDINFRHQFSVDPPHNTFVWGWFSCYRLISFSTSCWPKNSFKVRFILNYLLLPYFFSDLNMNKRIWSIVSMSWYLLWDILEIIWITRKSSYWRQSLCFVWALISIRRKIDSVVFFFKDQIRTIWSWRQWHGANCHNDLKILNVKIILYTFAHTIAYRLGLEVKSKI